MYFYAYLASVVQKGMKIDIVSIGPITIECNRIFLLEPSFVRWFDVFVLTYEIHYFENIKCVEQPLNNATVFGAN